MKRRRLCRIAVGIGSALLCAVSATGGAAPAATQSLQASYGRLGVSFEPNRGQTDVRVRFLGRHRGARLFLTSDTVWLTLHGQAAAVIGMQIDGANPRPEITGERELEGKVNYLRGRDPAKWMTDLPTFAAVRYREIYEGIDLIYYSNADGDLEYDFHLEPGADAGQIALKFTGAKSLRVDAASGDLVITTADGELRQRRPVVYQESEGGREAVESRYLVDGECVSFRIAEYDRTRALVIDPVLEYSTFVGGSAFDSGNGIAVDAQGNAYVTGITNSANFPTLNPIQTGPASAAFVTKINAAGTALVYSTYLGGNGSDSGLAIAVDANGNAYVTGNTNSSDFPTVNPVQAMNGGTGSFSDVFVAKLNATGNALVHSTYLGGTSNDGGRGIAVDSAGNVYVTGSTESSGFPTANAFDGTLSGTSDAFVTKIAAAGGSLVYSTFLGGTSTDSAIGIAVDAQGNAYVTGTTTGNTFPTVNPIQGATNSSSAFVTKINAAGTALVYSTFLGGDGADSGTGIALDPQGNACVTGLTTSSNFPLVNPVQSVRGGTSQDAFVAKLNAAGSAYVYSTYLGGTGTESPGGIAVDPSGNAYVIGITASSNFPLANPLDNSLGGTNDLYLTKLNPAGAFVYSTYFGGSGIDQGFAIAADASGSAYLTGLTSSSTFPTTVGAYDTTINGGEDVFIVKIRDPLPSALSATGMEGRQFTYQFQTTGTSRSVSGLPPGLSYDDTIRAIVGIPTTPGTFNVVLSATNASGTTNETLVLTVQAAPASGPIIASGTAATGRTGSPFTFQVFTSGGTSAARLSAANLPPGLTVDPVTGVISGIPTRDGSFAVELTVTDGAAVATGTVQLTFSSDPALPVITSPGSATLSVGQPFFYQIVAPTTAGPDDPTIFSLIGTLPAGLDFDPIAGTISGVLLNGNAEESRGAGPTLSGGVITNVQLFATNSHGTATIPLILFLRQPGVANISTRLSVGGGDDVLIGGFIVTGNAPKKVIIRAIAPSLSVGGVPVPGTLPDPTLELVGSGLSVTNDDWRATQESEIIASTVAPTDDREAALVATLNPGNYTAIVRGKNGATGISLVEVYDLGTATLESSSSAKLANISTRGSVQTADNVMIGGFIITGASSRVIVRAIGPDLTVRGVAGALQDTTLELHGPGGLIATNDDWESTQRQEIIDSTVPPNDPRESAIVENLPPGGYTAIVRGKDGSTGVALVEVYTLQ